MVTLERDHVGIETDLIEEEERGSKELGMIEVGTEKEVFVLSEGTEVDSEEGNGNSNEEVEATKGIPFHLL